MPVEPEEKPSGMEGAEQLRRLLVQGQIAPGQVLDVAAIRGLTGCGMTAAHNIEALMREEGFAEGEDAPRALAWPYATIAGFLDILAMVESEIVYQVARSRQARTNADLIKAIIHFDTACKEADPFARLRGDLAFSRSLSELAEPEMSRVYRAAAKPALFYHMAEFYRDLDPLGTSIDFQLMIEAIISHRAVLAHDCTAVPRRLMAAFFRLNQARVERPRAGGGATLAGESRARAG